MGLDAGSLRIRYTRELTDSVIPFWERHCPDPEHGGYLSCLDRDGAVYDTTKYTWMQWRIVDQLAALAETDLAGERREPWLDLARQGFDFLVRHGRDDSGAYYFALDRSGAPILAPYSIGADFFAIMACARLFRATGDDACRDAALASLQHVLGRLDNPKQQWNKQLPAHPRWQSHDTFMATVNLGLVLRECLDLPGLDDQVDEAVEAILHCFWQPELGVVLEHLGPDFDPVLDSATGRVVCPGHALESAWFVLQHAERQGREDRIATAGELIRGTLERAWDPEHGGLFYFQDVAGKPPPELTWDMKLWWVHCEALVAALLGYRLTGDDRLGEWFQRLDDWTWARFPDPAHGEWFGYLDRRGEPTHTLKGGQWKTCFHLPRALLVCRDELARLEESR